MEGRVGGLPGGVLVHRDSARPGPAAAGGVGGRRDADGGERRGGGRLRRLGGVAGRAGPPGGQAPGAGPAPARPERGTPAGSLPGRGGNRPGGRPRDPARRARLAAGAAADRGGGCHGRRGAPAGTGAACRRAGDVAVSVPARFPLAVLPTPLQPAVRLSAALAGPSILIKRDDLTGFALSGNKARKLEYLLGDALAAGCGVLLTGGGPDSNHCQAAAAAARVAGLACELVLYGDKPRQPRPNLELARRFGASVEFTGAPDRGSVDAALASRAEQLRAAGRRPYVIPRGGATPLGAVGYALAVHELAGQLAELDTDPAVVLVATGSCGTQAGLVAATEGLLLDPVFTAKAMAALVATVGKGLRGPAVFVHTGGMPVALQSIMGRCGDQQR